VHTTTLLTSQNFVYFVCFFFHSNRFVRKCDLFLFKILNTKLQTRFLRRYQTKPNTALESKAAFVHAIRVNESFAFLTLTVNNYFFSQVTNLSLLERHKLDLLNQHFDFNRHIFDISILVKIFIRHANTFSWIPHQMVPKISFWLKN
jgi:hypothetical protein